MITDKIKAFLADQGYDAEAVIPPRRKRKFQPDCDHAISRQRKVVERMVCRFKDWRFKDCRFKDWRFKDWRRVAARYDCTIKTFMTIIAIAATVIWWLT